MKDYHCKHCKFTNDTPCLLTRIAELEAENAALKADCARISAELGLPPTMAPADGEVKRILHTAHRERDEARAACAAVTKASNDFIRILGDIHHGPKPSQERFNEVADAFNKAFEQGSTAGSDLLARMENAAVDGKEELDMAHARIEELEARLEKAEAELKQARSDMDEEQQHYCNLLDERDALQAQLEAMRAALEAVLQWHDTGQHPDATPWADVRAALSPSAPRLSDEGAKVYAENRKKLMKPVCDRNAVIQECIDYLEANGDIDGAFNLGPFKDPEDGT